MVRPEDDLGRIGEALIRSAEIALKYSKSDLHVEEKSGGDPVTAADRDIDELLRNILPQSGDGWLSEETADDKSRLDCRRVWIVDPIDGTKEFIKGIPEWSISIGLVEDGIAVAGGICNPARNEFIVGSRNSGVYFGDQKVVVDPGKSLDQALILASRSEYSRGEWDRFAASPFKVMPCGSVAYKLALVAAGQATATWTLVPKNEWDVAAGAALVSAAGGEVLRSDGSLARFNQADVLLPGFIATPNTSRSEVWKELVADLIKLSHQD